jgi:hypothetical protein
MLEPAQAKIIGAKVAESDQARDLADRIKQVTRRRRLTTPPTTGPGGMDANTIAEYLDNEVTPEQSAEVEQICLASDVHLAEVAACHQILTLVLGEPALVPPTAKQRMYTLVKGPESIPFRKPAKVVSKEDQDLSSEIELDQDDSLRMGVPAVGKGGIDQRNLLLIIGGGALAVLLLAVALWQFMKPQPNVTPDNKKDEIAQADKERQEKEAREKKLKEELADKEKRDKEKTDKDKTDKEQKEKLLNPPEKKLPPIVIVPVEPDKGPEPVVYQPASTKEEPIGKYVQPPVKKAKDSIPQIAETAAVLLQKSDKGWTRIADKDARVLSGQPMVSLPGSKSVVALASGVEVTLWGNLQELTQDSTVRECRAILHVPATQLDADITLERGRIILRNLRTDGKDAQVRVRFFDTMQPPEKPKKGDKEPDKVPYKGKEEVFEIVLQGKGAAVIVDRLGQLDPGEPFYEDRNDPNRLGPSTMVKIYAYEGAASVSSGALRQLIGESGTPMLQWTSRQAKLGSPPEKEAVLPPWFKGITEPKDKGLLVSMQKYVNAHLNLAKAMDAKDNVENRIYVAIAELKELTQKNAQKEMIGGKPPSFDTYTQWRFCIICSGSVDMLTEVYDDFARNDTPIFIRGVCHEALGHWLSWNRDSDYELLEVVQKHHNNKKTAAEKILKLFHMIPEDDFRKPAIYETLIEGLNNDLLPIRMLSHWHLLVHKPEGAEIPYDPSPTFMPADRRQTAMRAWHSLITNPPKKKKTP